MNETVNVNNLDLAVFKAKSEIFDILAQQEQYQNAIQQLDQMKQQKLQELQTAITAQQQANAPAVTPAPQTEEATQGA